MSVTREFRSGDSVVGDHRVGGAEGRDYVLVHGTRHGAPVLGRHSPTPRPTGRVFALDLPGFGDAPEPSSPRWPEGASCLAALLEERWDLHDVVLVGHSMGAQIVAETAARHPERVGGVGAHRPHREPSGTQRARCRPCACCRTSRSRSRRCSASPSSRTCRRDRGGTFAKLRLMVDHRVEDALPERLRAGPGDPGRGRPHRAARWWAQEVSRAPARRPLHRGAGHGRRDDGHGRRVRGPGSWTRHARGEAVGIDGCTCPPSRGAAVAGRPASPGGPPTTRTRVCDSWRCSAPPWAAMDAAGPRRSAGGRDRPNCPRSCCCRASTSTGRSCVRSATR